MNRISEQIRRHSAAGVDVQVLPWQIDSVVSLKGSLPCPVELAEGEGLTLDLMAAMFDKGTRSRTKSELADRLERIGASISFSASGQRLDIGARCLARDLDMVLNLIREQLSEPAFDERELALVKGRVRAHLSRQKSDPAYMSQNHLSRSLYAEDHPSYEPSLDALTGRIEALEATDLARLHARSDLFDGLRLVVVGDVGSLDPLPVADMLEIRPEGDGSGFDKGAIPETLPSAPGEHHIQIADRPNLNVIMAHPVNVLTTSADYLPLWTGVFILGGNFSSRLMSTVRDERGLTYGISSYLSGMGARYGGAWMTSVTLSAEKLDEGVQATRSVLAGFVKGGITEAELEERKQTMIGSYEVDLSTTSGVASRLLLHMNRGWDPSRIDTHTDLVDAIQTNEVNGVIGRMLDPEGLTLVTAGSRS